MIRVVCIGNRWVDRDRAGPTVYDRLGFEGIPDGVELIDGGLGGLDLLRHLEGAERVIFVDSVSGFGDPGDVIVLDAVEVARQAQPAWDHAAGLPYLLRISEALGGERLPEIRVVGVETPCDDRSVERAIRAVHALTGAGFRDAEGSP